MASAYNLTFFTKGARQRDVVITRFLYEQCNSSRQTNCMTRMISRDYHFRYHSAYYIVYHRFLPKTYTKLFSIKGCCFCCCCFQCNFPYLIVGIRAWFAGSIIHLWLLALSLDFHYLVVSMSPDFCKGSTMCFVLHQILSQQHLLSFSHFQFLLLITTFQLYFY
jgi:hypothetical protein